MNEIKDEISKTEVDRVPWFKKVRPSGCRRSTSHEHIVCNMCDIDHEVCTEDGESIAMMMLVAHQWGTHDRCVMKDQSNGLSYYLDERKTEHDRGRN